MPCLLCSHQASSRILRLCKSPSQGLCENMAPGWAVMSAHLLLRAVSSKERADVQRLQNLRSCPHMRAVSMGLPFKTDPSLSVVSGLVSKNC